MDYVHYWKERAEQPAKQILRWMKVSEGTFYKWRQRYGKVNEHNGWIPRDHWLEEWEKRAILDFHWDHPLEGYRRLTYMMLDANVVAASASSVYRVLKRAGVMNRRNSKPSQKGKGFHQPDRSHRHWHVDIAPRLTVRAGFELGTGVEINVYPPRGSYQLIVRQRKLRPGPIRPFVNQIFLEITFASILICPAPMKK